MVALAVHSLHEHAIVHGNLVPDIMHWFSSSNVVKLGGLSTWALSGSPMPVRPALRYSAPEVSNLGIYDGAS